MGRIGFLLVILVCFDAWSAPLKLMVEDSWPPFAFREKGRAVGMSVDIVRAAFKNVGEDIELIQVPYPRCLAQTQSGKFVACFNSARSKEMDADFLFPKEPLFKSKGLIVGLRTGTSVRVQKVKDLEGRSVALPNGFPFGVEFDENSKINKVFTANDLTSLMMLNSRRVDFVAIDEYVFYYYLKNKPEFRDRFKIMVEMSEEPIYVHFSKKHADTKALMKKFELGLSLLKASAGYKNILENWVGPEGQRSVNVTAVVYSPAQHRAPLYFPDLMVE